MGVSWGGVTYTRPNEVSTSPRDSPQVQCGLCAALRHLAKGTEQELKSGPCPTCPVESPSTGLCAAGGRGRCLLKSTLRCHGGSHSSRWWDREERPRHCPSQRLLTPGRVSSPCLKALTPGLQSCLPSPPPALRQQFALLLCKRMRWARWH